MNHTTHIARRLVLSLTFLLAALTTSAHAATEIVRAEFGLFDSSAPGENFFSPTNTVPRKVGQRYGWIIELRTHERSLLVREEYVLPNKLPVNAPVAGTTTNDALLIANPRRHQVSERRLVPHEGRIVGEWAIGAGEAPGPRTLAITIEGTDGVQFDYRVE
jgi:hypothetical protein